jgi:hypothetical protein
MEGIYMSKEQEKRLRRLEIIENGESRVVVIVWPNDDADAALAAKGISTNPEDLVVIIKKDVETMAEGWVSINGVKV